MKKCHPCLHRKSRTGGENADSYQWVIYKQIIVEDAHHVILDAAGETEVEDKEDLPLDDPEEAADLLFKAH